MTVLLSVEVPDAPVVSHNSRGHWNERYDSHRTWKEAVQWLCTRATKIDVPVRVKLTCFAADRRRRDVDNWVLSTAVKGCLDGLVAAGVLEDDDSTRVREVTGRIVHDPSLRVHRWLLEVAADGDK